jgi:hypothetical protein
MALLLFQRDNGVRVGRFATAAEVQLEIELAVADFIRQPLQPVAEGFEGFSFNLEFENGFHTHLRYSAARTESVSSSR